MQAFATWAHDALGLSPAAQWRLLTTIGVVFALLVLRWMVLKAVRRHVADPHTRYRWQRATSYTVFVIAVLLAARIWLINFGGLATYLGLLSAGLAIALKDPLASLAAWLFILWRRPIEIGERVQVGTHSGDVVDIRLFQFTILEIGNWVDADQTTGRLINFPNHLIFTTPVANYTRSFQSIWTELSVLVTFESNWEKARALLAELAERHGRDAAELAGRELAAASQRYVMPRSFIAPAVYVAVEQSGVLLTLRVPCLPRERRQVTDAIWQDVLRAFAECPDVNFAYPTTRFYTHPADGPPGMSAAPPA